MFLKHFSWSVISYVLAIYWFKPLLFVTYTNHIEYSCNKHNTCVIASLSNIIQTMVASRLHLQYHTGKTAITDSVFNLTLRALLVQKVGQTGTKETTHDVLHCYTVFGSVYPLYIAFLCIHVYHYHSIVSHAISYVNCSVVIYPHETN